MPRPRAFDHEDLAQLVFAHPEWTDQRYADELTAKVRQDDPKAAPVSAGTVSSVLSRKRDAWQARAGIVLPNRLVEFTDFMPPANSIHPAHRNDTEIRYLRELAKDARGIHPRADEEWKSSFRRTALNWQDGMLAAGQLVDLDPHGVPRPRYATAAERNQDGSSKAIAAWLLPGWRGPRRG